MAPPPQSTDGAAAPVEHQPTYIEGVFPSGEIESVVPSFQVLATELTSEMNRSPDKNEPSGEIEAVACSTQGSVAELTSEVKQSPEKSEIKQSPKKSEIKKSPAEMENSVETEKSTAVEMSAGTVKFTAIEKHSQVENSAEKSSGEIDASKIKQPQEPSAQMENPVETEKSTAVEMSAGVLKSAGIENSAENSNGEIDTSKIKQSPENTSKTKQSTENNEPSARMDKHSDMEEESAQMEKSRQETGEFILRLDPSGAVSLMCVASPLYAVLAVLPLWLVADQPQALLWTFAHLACLYLFLWIITFSTARISTVFFSITYVLLLAFTVVHLIGPVSGIILLYTGMIYVAGMLGYAVAEHLQRAGFEQTANTLCSRPFNSKDCEELVSIMHFTFVLMSLPILARAAWVFLVPYSNHMDLMVELTAEIFMLAVLWITYITEFILRGALVSMERFVVSSFVCWIACYALAMLLSFKIAEAAGMLVMWLGWMAIGGFFGYTLAVRACYCKMLTRNVDSTPTAKEQNRGTL